MRAVLDARRRGDQRKAKLPLEALPDDLHVEQPEKPAPEAEAEGPGGLRLIAHGRIVQTQLLE